MQPTVPAPSAQGVLAKTPFAHLLIYVVERSLTGTLEIGLHGASAATIVVQGGQPLKVRLTEPAHFLGEVARDMGVIDQAQLDASLARMQESPRLQGEILVEMGALDQAALSSVLAAQLERKLSHLFALPPDAAFAYYDGVDGLMGYGGRDNVAIDAFPVVWRGVRETPSWEHVNQTLTRLGTSPMRLRATARLDRFDFTAQEQQVITLLAQRPMRLYDLTSAKILGPSACQVLCYALLITKQAELADRASLQPGAAPASAPPGAMPMPPSGPVPNPQAFARVQLQARAVQRAPLVVEEVSTMRADDGRIASPIPQAYPGVPQGVPPGFAPTPPAPFAPPEPPNAFAAPFAPGTSPVAFAPPGAPPPAPSPALSEPTTGMGMDIGALISGAIGASVPPPSVSQAPAAPAADAPPPSQSMPPSSRNPEQNAIKAKILERADKIESQNYFEMLELPADAPPEAVQKAFIAAAKLWHPDRLPPALADVRDACTKVFSFMSEAHATLTDPAKRADYMKRLAEGAATPQDQAMVQTALEAAGEFQKAELYLKRNENAQAYPFVQRAVELDPDQLDYLAVLAWLDAQKPQWQSREKTLEKIAILDRCLRASPENERALFYRGMLFKRIDEHKKAYQDFKKAMDINPRNLDAAREVRLHNMRGTGKKGGGSADSLGGLFGKLFKK